MLGLRFAQVACMRSAGSPDVLEYRRCLAVQRVAEGYSLQEVADFLDVDSSSVRRWLAASRHGGEGLSARPVAWFKRGWRCCGGKFATCPWPPASCKLAATNCYPNQPPFEPGPARARSAA